MVLYLHDNGFLFPWSIVWIKRSNDILKASYVHLKYSFLKTEDGESSSKILYTLFISTVNSIQR